MCVLENWNAAEFFEFNKKYFMTTNQDNKQESRIGAGIYLLQRMNHNINSQCVELYVGDLYDGNALHQLDKIMEEYANQKVKESIPKIRRNIKLALSSINGTLDGLELDNTSDVVEKSVVIEQLNELKKILSNE